VDVAILEIGLVIIEFNKPLQFIAHPM